jgi:SNF2 family DNA or RNA helicase
MGLGKTIQAISLILTNPRPALEVLEKDKKKKKIPLDTSTSTLVVAPLALIRQWESEIKTKAPSLKVLVHHGQSRTTSSTKLASHDIVITTYQTLMSEHVGGNSINGCFAVKWYRVILDEAHSIKNPKAKSTQACYDLSSIYRWCLTGTPLQNNLDELQSLIRFLRIKPYCDLQCWKRDITGPIKDGRGGIGLRRLHYFLRASMKRRTKDVLKKDGALGHNSESQSGQNFKIVGREVKAIVAEFDYNERKFYERLESRAQESLAEMMKRGNNDYIGALVLLLRLRQACNHPYLMKSKMEKDRDALATGSTNGSRAQQSQKAEDDEVDGLTNLLGGLSVQTKKCDVCKAKMSIEEVNKGAERCAACDADLEENLSQERRDRKKGKSKKPKKNIKENARLRKERRRRVIVDSDDEDKAEWIDPNHKPTEIAGELNTDDEDAEGGGDWIGDEDSQTSDEEQDKHSSSDEEEPEQEVNYNFYKPVRFNADAITNDLPPSTKIKQLLNILKEETPEHKVIVFSQFTSMLDIIEPFLEKKGYRFVRYDGSMRNDQREESLNLLRNNKKTRVLLCSLKCGSLGLNLTAASRVVIMEPFWNPVSEIMSFSNLVIDHLSLSKNKPSIVSID